MSVTLGVIEPINNLYVYFRNEQKFDMCDSFVSLGNSTKDGSVLHAKSADTEVNEAEHVVRYGREEFDEGTLVRITHRTKEKNPAPPFGSPGLNKLINQ